MTLEFSVLGQAEGLGLFRQATLKGLGEAQMHIQIIA